MIDFRIEMMGRSAPLDDIELPAPIQKEIAPLRTRLSEVLRSRMLKDEALHIVFVIDEERRLSISLRGSPLAVNQARDATGEEMEITSRLN